MPAADMPLIVDLAGRDDELRAPLDDLRLGRWSAARDLLRRTGPDWELRTSRSLVLSVGAGSLGAIKAWLSEEPFSADALMMWARVLTREALRAMDKGRDRDLVLQSGTFARDACFGAVGRWPEDPVPWVDLLRLAKLPVGRRGLRLLDPYLVQRLQLWGQSIEMNRWDEAPRRRCSPGHGPCYMRPTGATPVAVRHTTECGSTPSFVRPGKLWTSPVGRLAAPRKTPRPRSTCCRCTRLSRNTSADTAAGRSARCRSGPRTRFDTMRAVPGSAGSSRRPRSSVRVCRSWT